MVDKRSAFFRRLRELRAAGLPPHSAMALLRTRTAGDYVFVARACGIPERDARAMDRALLAEVETILGGGLADAPAGRKAFLRSADGGLGFQSVQRTSPVAYAASWHACLPTILKLLNLPAASALMALSPWLALCLPVANCALQEATGDGCASIGDEGLAASQHSLAKAPLAAAARQVLEEVSVDSRAVAAMRSAGGPGAGVWTNAPVLPNQHLSAV